MRGCGSHFANRVATTASVATVVASAVAGCCCLDRATRLVGRRFCMGLCSCGYPGLACWSTHDYGCGLMWTAMGTAAAATVSECAATLGWLNGIA